VVMAVQESSTVHFRALGAFRACAAAADETRADNDARGMGAPIPAAQGEADRNVALDAAQIAASKEADAAEDALIEVIRARTAGTHRSSASPVERDRAARSGSVFALGCP
jgi:hypothetical protein